MIVSVNWIGPVHLRNWELNHLPLKLSSNGSILYFLNPNIVFDGVTALQYAMFVGLGTSQRAVVHQVFVKDENLWPYTETSN